MVLARCWSAAWPLGLAAPVLLLAGGSLAPRRSYTELPALAIQEPEAASIDGFLGFRVGEERRYELGPREAVELGEYSEWTILLEGVEESEDGPRGVFKLVHERGQLLDWRLFDTAIRRTEARLAVNEHAFPLRIEYTEQVLRADGSDPGTARYPRNGVEVRYAWAAGGYDVDFDVPESAGDRGRRNYRPFRVERLRFDQVDPSVPRGLYLYTPSLGARAAFVNPGLLSLVYPELREGNEAGEDFVFLMPTTRRPAPPSVRPRSIDTRDGARVLRDLGRAAPPGLARYFRPIELAFREPLRIEVGSRLSEAWRYSIGGLADSVYFDAEGRVLRVDFDEHGRGRRRLSIRLLFPSEY